MAWRSAVGMRRRPSSCRVSFRCAAEFSISLLRMRKTRCGLNFSAMKWNRSAGSMWPPSVAWKRCEATTITMLEPTASDRAHFTSYLPAGTWFMLIEPNELQEEGKFYLERMDRPQAFHAVRPTLEEIYKFPSVTASGVPAGRWKRRPTWNSNRSSDSAARFQRFATSWKK